MELYQEVALCLSCGTRLTVCGQREPDSELIASYEVTCPVCWRGVTFATRGLVDPRKACLICYERPVPNAAGSRPSGAREPVLR
jgi:hypothetical protein